MPNQTTSPKPRRPKKKPTEPPLVEVEIARLTIELPTLGGTALCDQCAHPQSMHENGDCHWSAGGGSGCTGHEPDAGST